jgi:hypothetical protein
MSGGRDDRERGIMTAFISMSEYRRMIWVLVIGAGVLVSQSCLLSAEKSEKPWLRHTIDDSSRGADGVRLADANGDGLMDIATPWEEGGLIRAYLNPGHARVREKWPAVTVGAVGSPEDAVFVDLEGDGAVDVVSCCEGDVKTMYVHWAPKEKGAFLDSSSWRTEPIPVTERAGSWMFCVPAEIDGKNGVDLVAGSKGEGAQVGWLESPRNPRHLADWKWHPIRKAGWTMSLFATDMDGDGDLDILATDRKGPARGCFWLEHPGDVSSDGAVWKEHPIGSSDKEVMFLVPVDLDADRLLDVLTAIAGRELVYHRRLQPDGLSWRSYPIHLPEQAGNGKGVNVGDLNLDGKLDIVFTCEGARGKSGVMWLSHRGDVTDAVWDAHDISGTEGVKFDLVQLLDGDGDGDLDVITCEEQTNLGVIWYENPTR